MPEPLSSSEIVLLLEEATQSPPASLAEDTELAGVGGWDSMGMVMFTGLVNERVGIELSVADLLDCRTPVQIAEVLGRLGRT